MIKLSALTKLLSMKSAGTVKGYGKIEARRMR